MLYYIILYYIILYYIILYYIILYYIILAGVPGVARDEKLQKQIFEIAWTDKSWID